MTLAWFVLMTIGAFTARYYKETAGINDKTGNSMLGLGYWIWVTVYENLLHCCTSVHIQNVNNNGQ